MNKQVDHSGQIDTKIDLIKTEQEAVGPAFWQPAIFNKTTMKVTRPASSSCQPCSYKLPAPKTFNPEGLIADLLIRPSPRLLDSKIQRIEGRCPA